jgi:hypothetical protein
MHNYFRKNFLKEKMTLAKEMEIRDSGDTSVFSGRRGGLNHQSNPGGLES